MKAPIRTLLSTVLLLFAIGCVIAEDGTDSTTCNDAGLFDDGGIFSKICWTCFYPITIAGQATTAGSVPITHASPMCTCPGRLGGTPTPGVTAGMWQPMRMVELVRSGKGCSPTLGSDFELFDSSSPYGAMLQGGGARHADQADQEGSYYNFHIIRFPVGQLTDMLTDSVCAAEMGSTDADLLYVSELDPTWNNEELALFTTPEAALFANPLAQAACMADAVAASVAQPIPGLFWCAGSWGSMYPFSGMSGKDSEPAATSLAAARAIAMMHRRGMALLTQSDRAVCRDIPWVTIPRNQYKLQTIHPIAETKGNHWIGASTFRWGEWRNVPAVGEDFVYLVWNFQECCMNL